MQLCLIIIILEITNTEFPPWSAVSNWLIFQTQSQTLTYSKSPIFPYFISLLCFIEFMDIKNPKLCFINYFLWTLIRHQSSHPDISKGEKKIIWLFCFIYYQIIFRSYILSIILYVLSIFNVSFRLCHLLFRHITMLVPHYLELTP